MSEIFPQLGYQLGIGGVGGFIVGYATKKLSKLIAIIVGLVLIGLIYLNVKGIISINYDALWNALSSAMSGAGSAFSCFVNVIALLPFAGSFTVGFLLGFKVG